MSLHEDVETYLANGGVITVIPGFESIAPLPERSEPVVVAGPTIRRREPKAVTDFYTVNEAAELLDVSYYQLQRRVSPTARTRLPQNIEGIPLPIAKMNAGVLALPRAEIDAVVRKLNAKRGNKA